MLSGDNILILFSTAVDDVIEDIRTALIEYNVIASQALVDSMKAFNSTRERNFTQHLDNIAENIQMTESVTFQTEETLRRVRLGIFLKIKCEKYVFLGYIYPAPNILLF